MLTKVMKTCLKKDTQTNQCLTDLKAYLQVMLSQKADPRESDTPRESDETQRERDAVDHATKKLLYISV